MGWSRYEDNHLHRAERAAEAHSLASACDARVLLLKPFS